MTVWQMETLDGWEEVMMINTLGCSNYGYWAKIAAEYNHTGTVTTELHLDSFWEIDQLAFVCHPSDSRGLGWLAVTFCVGIVLVLRRRAKARQIQEAKANRFSRLEFNKSLALVRKRFRETLKDESNREP